MPPVAFTFDNVPQDLFKPLKAHLPFSLPVLRRLQYASFPGGWTSTSRVVLVHDSSEAGNSRGALTKFTVGYVDVGGGPDTQMWLYSTLEDHQELTKDETSLYEEQLDCFIRENIQIAQDYGRELVYPGGILLGSLNSKLRSLLEKMGRVHRRPTGIYDKWLFRVEDVPENETQLPEGAYWDSRASEDDCKIVISRTDIPRTVKGLYQMPSLMLKLEDGTPIAWAFLSGDGSLASLHCEPDYRRRGFAKLLAAKLIRERSRDFGDDGWCSADVHPDNHGSRGMCTALNGKTYWKLSW
ncbi:hypothetical protein B0T10DRAFT_412288 [Thelonectria olida]|uniref:N-acetyltransferase domain-containing protein n=1 Tax=Thelonectria olida TaxID=1576542 RepID=A0A9P8VWS6_9HYPO|nr:hypothetical protein B0T10DRAFT_412288 [Thelonectria olida]